MYVSVCCSYEDDESKVSAHFLAIGSERRGGSHLEQLGIRRGLPETSAVT